MCGGTRRVQILALLATLLISEADVTAPILLLHGKQKTAPRKQDKSSVAARVAQRLRSGARITYAARQAILWQAPAGRAFELKAPAVDEEYNLDHSSAVYFSQWGQEEKLWQPVLERIDGLRQEGYKPFFLESGARDGEAHSNTLYLERNLSWVGLLVEPSNQEFPKLLTKKRKSWAFHGVLSPTGSSADLEFLDDGIGLSHLRGIGQGPEAGPKVHKMRTPAEPLAALLGRIQPPVDVVDFWSLDIEGSEGPVLESTDFTKTEVGVLMIEMNKGPENNARIQKVMGENGFQDIGGTTYDGGILDHVFVNPNYFQKRNLEVPKPFDQGQV